MRPPCADGSQPKRLLQAKSVFQTSGTIDRWSGLPQSEAKSKKSATTSTPAEKQRLSIWRRAQKYCRKILINVERMSPSLANMRSSSGLSLTIAGIPHSVIHGNDHS
jgi:hypothetical protein